MQTQREDRLRELLGRYGIKWHAGRRHGRTLYDGEGEDDGIGYMDSRPLAELVVLLHAYAREQLFGERED